MEQISRADFDVDDFMRISPSLVRKLGSANDAIVLARIVFRCALETRFTVEHDGDVWWPASVDALADETGLTAGQTRSSLKRLAEAGLIVSEELKLGGPTDRTKAHRPVVPHAPSPNNSICSPEQFELHSRTDVPYIEEPNKKEIQGDASRPATERVTAAFERAWSAWPKKVERKDAERRFREAIKQVPIDDLVEMIREHGAAYAAHREKVFTPGLATWLHKERWTDELVEPEAGRGAAVRPAERPGHLDRAQTIIELGKSLDGRTEPPPAGIPEIGRFAP